MTRARLRKFDRLSRYQVCAFLFGLVYLLLLTRIFHWPDLPRSVILTIYLTLTTPAMALLLYNLTEASVKMYKARRTIDDLLQEQKKTP